MLMPMAQLPIVSRDAARGISRRSSSTARTAAAGSTAKGCVAGVPRLPYRLPELLAADPAAPVVIVGGEKDADRLASLGFVATTNSEDAGKFRTELAPHFAGRRVVIIPDNDKPGAEHAADVEPSRAIALISLRMLASVVPFS